MINLRGHGDRTITKLQNTTLVVKSFLSREWAAHGILLLGYSLIACFFLFGVLTSRGNAAQQDWTFPVTANSSWDNLYQHFFIWHLFGFGGVVTYFDLLFSLPSALFAQIGFFGGAEIKILAVGLVAIGGWFAYLMCRSFGISRSSSFLSGLFFMTTALVFDYLMFGWTYNMISYDLLPLFILITKKGLETGALRYALAGGIILALALMYPQAAIFYIPVLALIVIFVAGTNFKIILKGLLHSIITLGIGALSYTYFFTSYTGIFYSFSSDVVSAINENLTLANVARFWGSTYNYQFETYFPKSLLLFSFIPLVIASLSIILKPRNKWLYFFAFLYIFSLLPELAGNAVFSLPFGFAFRILSLFLIPSALGIAALIGFSSDAILIKLSSLRNNRLKKYAGKFLVLAILLLIVLSGAPWWLGQTSGAVASPQATKLNLVELPHGFVDWNKFVPSNDSGMFVLYWPISSYIQFENTLYYSETFQGVNNPFFQPATNFSPVLGSAAFFSSMSRFFNGNYSQLGEVWGNMSIKYIVVFTNTSSSNFNYATADDLLNGLYKVNGVVEIYQSQGVIVFEDQYAKPVVYSNNTNASIDIISRNPTYYKVAVNASSPFTLILNQQYDQGWTASIDGKAIPVSDHFAFDDSYNAWQVNSSGQLTIELYYQPQTNYLAGVLISMITFYGVFAYLIAIAIKDLIVKRNKKVRLEKAITQ